MHGRDKRGDAGVVGQGVRVAAEQKLGLDAAAVALDLGRLGVDETSEFADGMLVATLVDERLPLLRGAFRVARRSLCHRCRQEQGSSDGDSERVRYERRRPRAAAVDRL